ncbi:MAG: hypothetical protein IJS86_01110 [Lachnospiraceae bacterium]|nr:hypothetical protein [Lachnospiraceae bacterium]
MEAQEKIKAENRAASENSETARQAGENDNDVLKANASQLVVQGVRYASIHDAAAAREELKKIMYIKSRMNYNNPVEVLAIYNKMIENKLFVTPTGHEFLFEIRSFLMQSPAVDPDSIYTINTESLFTQRARNEARASMRPSTPPDARAELKKMRNGYRTSVIVNIFLILVIIALFAIALNSDNPNILNYRNVIENQYAEWEENLEERERQLKEKERQTESDQNGKD